MGGWHHVWYSEDRGTRNCELIIHEPTGNSEIVIQKISRNGQSRTYSESFEKKDLILLKKPIEDFLIKFSIDSDKTRAICTSPHDIDRNCGYKLEDKCTLKGECNWKEITPNLRKRKEVSET